MYTDKSYYNTRMKQNVFQLVWLMVCLPAVSHTYRLDSTLGSTNVPPYVIFIHPVTDLTIKPQMPERYAASPEPGHPVPRSYQALFNETARVIKKEGSLYHISFDDMIYGFDPETGQPQSEFWVHESRVYPITQLSDMQQTFIPKQDTHTPLETIILTLPFQGYSAGTRFRVNAYTTDYFEVMYNQYTQENPKTYTLRIPTTHAQWYLAHDDISAGTQCMIQYGYDLLAYAAAQNGEIPFVWGGCSVTHIHQAGDGYQPFSGSSWERGDRDTLSTTYHGFDASSFLFRLASMAGIGRHYPCKTTHAASQILPCIDPREPLGSVDEFNAAI